jgi:hypothetical protein
VPEWLRPSAEENLALIAARRAVRSTDAAAARAELAALDGRHDLPTALGDVARAAWCFDNVGAIEGGEVFSRITGWTSDHDGLRAAIEGADARALASFPKPPRGVHPPLLLRNPWWARPFEIFSRLFGMPGQHGADPGMLLAVAVPPSSATCSATSARAAPRGRRLRLRKRMPVCASSFPPGCRRPCSLLGSIFQRHLIHPFWINPLRSRRGARRAARGRRRLLTARIRPERARGVVARRARRGSRPRAASVLVYFAPRAVPEPPGCPGPAARFVAIAGAVVFCALGHARRGARDRGAEGARELVSARCRS